LYVKKANPSDDFAQARNQLGTPGGAKSFLRGVQNFKTMSNTFQYAQQIFVGEGEKICKGDFALLSPLVTSLCPILSKYVQHIFKGRGDFAPYCCVDRLATVEAFKMNVHFLLL